MEIDQTSPGSHTVLALIRLQLSIAIYSLEVKLSNPFWVNPAFWCRPIDLLSAVLLLIYLPWANVFIWWIPRQTHIKAVDHHLIRFQRQKKKKNLWFRFGIVLDCIVGPSCSWHIPPEKTPYGYLKLSLAAEAPAEQRSNFVFMQAGLVCQLLRYSSSYCILREPRLLCCSIVFQVRVQVSIQSLLLVWCQEVETELKSKKKNGKSNLKRCTEVQI